MPEPVLELVNGGEEQCGEQCGGDTDDGASDEVKGTPPRNGLIWLGAPRAHRIVLADAVRVQRLVLGEDLDAPVGRVAHDLAAAERHQNGLAHERGVCGLYR